MNDPQIKKIPAKVHLLYPNQDRIGKLRCGMSGTNVTVWEPWTFRAVSRPVAAALGATERRRGLLLIRISIAANNTRVAVARSGVRRLVAACSASVNRQTGRLAALLHGPRSTIDRSKGVAANPGGKPPVCGSIGLLKAATSRRTPERAGPVLMTAKCCGDWMYSVRSLRFLCSSPVLSAGYKLL